jgi:hypothetical protein
MTYSNTLEALFALNKAVVAIYSPNIRYFTVLVEPNSAILGPGGRWRQKQRDNSRDER